MKPSNFLKSLIAFTLFLGAISVMAQQPVINNYRPNAQEGINIFESPKGDVTPFEGIKVRIGGSFTQQYQALSQESTAPFRAAESDSTKNLNELFPLGPGFNLASANLNLDVQLADGIRLALENYMSSRHHSEFWVKGGYIQVDKLPMFGNPKWFTDYCRVKIGHFTPNFGDMQFRRSDGGNTMFNPFVENLIFDAFATEIGGEVYVFPVDGFMGMVGLTSGFINGNIDNYPAVPVTPNVEPSEKKPSVTVKLAYDKTFESKFRFRLSASLYNNSSSARNTLYAGDRTGSHYFMVVEPSTGTYAGNKDSGRFTSMGLANKVNAISINPFIKYKGVEIFGDYQIVKGRTNAERNGSEREFNQLAVEGLYRFLSNERAYVGARYIQAKGTPQGFAKEVSMDRFAVAAGWFPTKNLLLKGEYVTQNYKDFPTTDYRNEAQFSGFVVEAVIGF